MGRLPIRLAGPLLVVSIGLAACGNSSNSTSAESADTQVRANASTVPKIVHPLPEVSDLDKRVSFTKKGVTSTMGTGIDADFTDIGLPIYPTMKAAETYVIKHEDKKTFGMTIQGTIQAPATTVDAWYVRALGPSFTAGRAHLLGGEIGTFSRKRPGDIESILVQAERDAQTRAEVTTLTLTVTKRR